MDKEQDTNFSSLEPHRLEYQNALERISQQAQTIQEFSNDGHQTLRITFVVAGILITAFSYLREDIIMNFSNNTCAVDFVVECMQVGFVAKMGAFWLAVAAILNMVNSGVEARGLGKICEVVDIKEQIGNERNEKEYLESRLKKYKSRIRDNDEVISTLETSLALGKATLALGVLSSGIVAYTVVTGQYFGPVISIGVSILILSIPKLVERSMPERYNEAERVSLQFLR